MCSSNRDVPPTLRLPFGSSRCRRFEPVDVAKKIDSAVDKLFGVVGWNVCAYEAFQNVQKQGMCSVICGTCLCTIKKS